VKGNGITVTRTLRSVLPILLAASLAACGQTVSETFTQVGQAAPEPPTASALPAPSFPLTLTDDAGRAVEIPAEPQRIVSLAPSNTEIVCALDACDRLVGVPEFRDGYPPDVLETIADVPNVVAFGPVDREAIVAAEPDLVLAAGNELTPSDDISALIDLGYPVLTLYPESVDEVFADIQLVGAAIGAAAEADALVTDGQDRVEAVFATVADAAAPRTFYEVSVFEGQIYTAGEDSFLASLLELAGAEPITGDALSTAIDLETLVAQDPQVILLGDAAYDPSITPEAVAERQGWSEMTAVVDGNVKPVPDDFIVTRPGPRIVDGIESLARLIHPELFD
jgi:iron complex transport system substrate-binding protein